MNRTLPRQLRLGLHKLLRPVADLRQASASQQQIRAQLSQVLERQIQLTEDVRRLRELCNEIRYQTVVAPDGLPLPPPDLHYLVSGDKDLDAEAFLEIGRACAARIREYVNRHASGMDRLQAVLDFGCGCGRVIRHFHALQNVRLYGTDYNPRLVQWCQANLPFATFGVNRLDPPLDYAAETFELVYAFSVFTHLPQQLQSSWMRELSRVLKPGGYLFITTLGESFVSRARLNEDEKARFDAGEPIVRNEELAGHNECAVLAPFKYVTESLATDFELLEFEPGQVVDPSRRLTSQDKYFLRKVA